MQHHLRHADALPVTFRQLADRFTNHGAQVAKIHDHFKPGQVYNIAGSHRTDIKAVSDTILHVLERDDKIVDYAPPEPMTTKDKIVDNSRMIRDLGAQPEISFEEGIRRTINWQRQVYGL